MIKIVLHGYLKEQYPEFAVSAETAAEAIEAWSLQTSMVDLSFNQKPVIDVIGFDTDDKLFAVTTVTELHLVPRMAGGGGFGKILLGAALIGLSFVPGLGQIGQVALSTVLFSAGASLMISGIMQLFMKTPRVDSENSPEPSKLLGAPTNTTEIGTPIPRGYGRFKVGGHYLSVQVNAQDLVYGRFPTTI